MAASATLPEWLGRPLSHSAREAGPATQLLSRSGHSVTQSLRVAEWLSGWVAASAALPEWLSGCFDFASRVAHPLKLQIQICAPTHQTWKRPKASPQTGNWTLWLQRCSWNRNPFRKQTLQWEAAEQIDFMVLNKKPWQSGYWTSHGLTCFSRAKLMFCELCLTWFVNMNRAGAKPGRWMQNRKWMQMVFA